MSVGFRPKAACRVSPKADILAIAQTQPFFTKKSSDVLGIGNWGGQRNLAG